MRKRLVLVAVCILALPLLYQTAQSDKVTSPSPYATVALAGHTTAGNWCEYGTPGCLYDPGEGPGTQSANSVSDQTDTSLKHGAPPRSNGLAGFDFGSGALMLALAFFLWTRLRA